MIQRRRKMSESKLVWKRLKEAKIGFWKRIENSVEEGFPDTLYCIQGRTGLAELKYMRHWPKKAETKTTLGVRPIQEFFLRQWKKNGGRGWVIARVGDEWLLIDPDNLGEKTRAEWIEQAEVVGEMVDIFPYL